MPSDGSSRIVVLELPGWLQALRPVATTLVTFGKNPVGFVFGIISLYISSLFLDLFGIATGVVLGIFDTFGYVFDLARRFLIGSFGQLGVGLLNVVLNFGRTIARGLDFLGPAAPIVVGLIAGVVMYGLYRLVIGLLGELPVGSTLVDLLRLR